MFIKFHKYVYEYKCVKVYIDLMGYSITSSNPVDFAAPPLRSEGQPSTRLSLRSVMVPIVGASGYAQLRARDTTRCVQVLIVDVSSTSSKVVVAASPQAKRLLYILTNAADSPASLHASTEAAM